MVCPDFAEHFLGHTGVGSPCWVWGHLKVSSDGLKSHPRADAGGRVCCALQRLHAHAFNRTSELCPPPACG